MGAGKRITTRIIIGFLLIGAAFILNYYDTNYAKAAVLPCVANANCDDGNQCTADICDTVTGTCTNSNTCGGLVPCGRLVDNLKTSDIDESKPCDLCSAMYMLKQMLNFAVEIAVGIAVFIIILGGFLYAFSAGNPANVEKAKSAITNSIIGLVIMFSAWLIVAAILNAMGYADITTWNQVNCALQK